MKNKRRRTSRIKNLVIVVTLTAIMLTVSTFAWFVGMRAVNVTSFDVEIASTESLLLSLNGTKWASEVTISKDNLDTVSYSGHKNTWGGDKGLIPMSSIGEMDESASRMKLYEKASFTPSPGGYRLLASRVLNTDPTKDEAPGYVAFDLFIKNFSGNQYITELNPLDEEAIFLTTDSAVTVADAGNGGVADTGIENSVRVAFTQIGRVAATVKDAGVITAITCSDTGGSNPVVTGICRDAQIWEPNDLAHVDGAIDWYEESCLKRTGADITKSESFISGSGGKCGLVEDETYYSTYAVAQAITSANRVDVYDGTAYNGYEASITSGFLTPIKTFTDTDKDLPGTKRPQFMTLAPNSITKVRIYVYIEGQDIDNYDFAQIGKKISVGFGFTKERFVPGDIDYEGPSIPEMPPYEEDLGSGSGS